MLSNRIYATVSVGATKLFLGGACWQLFATFASDVLKEGGDDGTRPYHTTSVYMLCTGLGDAFGVVIGMVLLSMIESKWHLTQGAVPFPSNDLLYRTSGALISGCVLDGGAWQVAKLPGITS